MRPLSILEIVSERVVGHHLRIMSTLFRSTFYSFLRDDQGQDLIEYTLLMAFIALASASIFISVGGSTNVIWSAANSQLSSASAAVS
jgi:Flp pilus assembly pilin Flp